MTDPHRPEAIDPTRYSTGPSEPSDGFRAGYPPYVDPAYAGQLPTYGAGYPPPGNSNAAPQTSQQNWAPGQPPPAQPPAGDPADSADGDPPGPPRSPRWLWLLAGAAVLLVVGLVIALVIANGSAKKPGTVTLPRMPSTVPPGQAPATTTRVPAPSASPSPSTSAGPTAAPPTQSTSPGVAQTVVYSVSGDGRAISIAYIDTGGVLQTEFNVVLPWRKQVSLEPPASKAASVTVVNIGEQVTCAVSVDGAQVRQRTGTILTICAGGG